MIIRVSAVDPALRNFGMALLDYDTERNKFDLVELQLIQTVKLANKKKQIRQNSDDLRRAREIKKDFFDFIRKSRICFAEIPAGAQDARSALSFGISIGVIACSPTPIIEVQPSETKMAAVGTRTASKDEMIDWAYERYPNAPWITNARSKKRAGNLTDDNEHLADAIAVAHAGVETEQFKQLMALYEERVQAKNFSTV